MPRGLLIRNQDPSGGDGFPSATGAPSSYLGQWRSKVFIAKRGLLQQLPVVTGAQSQKTAFCNAYFPKGWSAARRRFQLRRNSETATNSLRQNSPLSLRNLPLGTRQYRTRHRHYNCHCYCGCCTTTVAALPRHSSTSFQSVSPVNRLRGGLSVGRENWRHISSAANR